MEFENDIIVDGKVIVKNKTANDILLGDGTTTPIDKKITIRRVLIPTTALPANFTSTDVKNWLNTNESIGDNEVLFWETTGDTTAPTILTAKVENAEPNKLVVVFSEVVTITNTTGLTITGAATPTLSAPTGSGTDTITFTLSTALTNGQSVTLNVASSNTIKDAANNTLAATTRAITNNVAVVSAYDVDYQAVLDAATTNGDPLPDAAQQDIDNQLMIDYKATGVYTKRDIILKANGTAAPAFKLYCWKRKIRMVAYGGLTWDNDGVLSNGTNGYIDPLYDGRLSSNVLPDNVGVEYVISNIYTSTAGAVLGTYTGSNLAEYLFIAHTGGGSEASIHSSVPVNAEYASTGYSSVNRISNTTVRVQDINTDLTFNFSSGSLVFNNVTLLCRNREDNGGKDNFYKNKVSFISIGASVQSEYAALKAVLD